MEKEWKIGEIRQINGEWYQCIDGGLQCCSDCAFYQLYDFCHSMLCSLVGRADRTHVIFKKLEKVGEPYYNSEKKLCQQYKCYIDPLVTDEIVYVFADNRAVIEIKQTKEDMEENKLNLKPFDIQKAKDGKPVCTRDGRKARIICFDKQEGLPIVALVERNKNGRISEEIALFYINGRAISADIDSKDDLMMLPEKKKDIPEFDKVVDECLFGEDKPNLKPFDFEAAKAGKPVCTRDGRKARIICFDKKCLHEQVLIALVDCGKEESIYFYTTDGKCIDDFSSFDLMMLPEKKSGWINIKKDEGLFKSREEAERDCTEGYAAVMVEFEI